MGGGEKNMVKQDIMAKVGSWSFIIGIIIALIFGFYEASQLADNGTSFFATNNGAIVAWLLAIIGIIIGILAVLGKGTITKKEMPGFLFASIALLIMGSVFIGWHLMIPYWLGAIFGGVSMSLAIFVAPAVGILAVKAIWDMGKDV